MRKKQAGPRLPSSRAQCETMAAGDSQQADALATLIEIARELSCRVGYIKEQLAPGGRARPKCLEQPELDKLRKALVKAKQSTDAAHVMWSRRPPAAPFACKSELLGCLSNFYNFSAQRQCYSRESAAFFKL